MVGMVEIDHSGRLAMCLHAATLELFVASKMDYDARISIGRGVWRHVRLTQPVIAQAGGIYGRA
jgi:hypothetical protein